MRLEETNDDKTQSNLALTSYRPWSSRTSCGVPFLPARGRTKTFAGCGSQWQNPVLKICEW